MEQQDKEYIKYLLIQGTVSAIITIILLGLITAIIIIPTATQTATQIRTQIQNEIGNLKIAAATEIGNQISKMEIICEDQWKENTMRITLGEESLYCGVKNK